MAKLNRERKLIEKRLEKQARKHARKQAAALEAEGGPVGFEPDLAELEPTVEPAGVTSASPV